MGTLAEQLSFCWARGLDWVESYPLPVLLVLHWTPFGHHLRNDASHTLLVRSSTFHLLIVQAGKNSSREAETKCGSTLGLRTLIVSCADTHSGEGKCWELHQ